MSHDGFSQNEQTQARSRFFDFLIENYDVRTLVLDNLSVYEFAMLSATNRPSAQFCPKTASM